MKFFRYLNANRDARLIAEAEPGKLFDLTHDSPIRNFTDLVRWSRLMGRSLDELVENLLQKGDRQVTSESLSRQGLRLVRPLVPPEVWAAGVTYRKSRDERERESETPDPYAKVYRAERPEIFLKATPARCVGPGEAVGVRGDSGWDVPEAELAFILHDGRITGYTAGNDVSSRAIEGANPLYIPQAKIYRRCCSIGPCIVSAESVPDPHNLTVTCEIFRDGDRVFAGETSTSRMVRTCQKLAGFLTRHNPVPDGTVVLTGTGIVPHQEFTLQAGDLVRIEIEGIGILENPVVQV
jgi:2-dehydro-3-deoxy-D-arabinonate dehydratase